jgi:outer membrane protein
MSRIFVFRNAELWSRWLPLLTVFLFSFALSADAMGIMDVYRQAVEKAPTIRSYHFRTLIEVEAKRQALAAFLPTIVTSAGYTYSNQDIISSENAVYSSGSSDFGTTTYDVRLTQPLFNWASYVGWKQSEVLRARSEIELVLAGQELIVRVADLYFQALAARDRLEFAVVEQSAVAKHFERAQSRLNMGLIPVTELHDAKARLTATQAQTIQARNDLSDALNALSEVIGGDVAGDLASLREGVAFAYPEPRNLEPWVQAALRDNPAVGMGRKAVEAAELEVERKRGGHFPTVDAFGSYENEDTDGSLFGGSSHVESVEVGVMFTAPMYQGGLIASRVREARHDVAIARQDLEMETRSVDRKTRAAFLGVHGALRRGEALGQSVEANRLALEAKQEGYLSGLYTSLAVLDAERDLALVGIDQAQARYDFVLNGLRLKQAVGTLAERDLEDLENRFMK